MNFPARLYEPGPKRLLALDGGGVRGILSLAYLHRIEAILRETHDNPALVLGDYFDFIGGTSTGAIIAALLALGRSVDEIQRMYLSLGREVFRPARWFGTLQAIFRPRFNEAPLARLLRKELGDRTLGDNDFRCGLMVVAKRADTSSVWPMINIPSQKYFELNKQLSLWEILRASTAAPTYFRPQLISDVGAGEQAVFVDGAISMHNSPALLLLMAATLKGYGLDWPTGEDKLLLVSVGTGAITTQGEIKKLAGGGNLAVLPVVMTQLLSDAAELGSTLLQWISRSPTARVIDTQIGDLSNDLLTPSPLLTYLRYDVPLSVDGLQALGFTFGAEEIAKFHTISNSEMIPLLQSIGEQSSRQIEAAHFPTGFNLSRDLQYGAL